MTQTRKRKSKKMIKEGATFTEENFNSGDGMLTTVWGPSMWHSLHTISFNYPVHPSHDDKKRYRDFVLSLQYVLPCKNCRMNVRKNFEKLPLTKEKLQDRASFSRYIYDLHETVNEMLGKKSGLSYEDVRERYEHFRANCVVDKKLLPKTNTKSKSKTIVKTRKNKLHKGCVRPLYGKKAKCVIHIVPQEKKIDVIKKVKQEYKQEKILKKEDQKEENIIEGRRTRGNRVNYAELAGKKK
jgi:hypothetical protein